MTWFKNAFGGTLGCGFGCFALIAIVLLVVIVLLGAVAASAGGKRRQATPPPRLSFQVQPVTPVSFDADLYASPRVDQRGKNQRRASVCRAICVGGQRPMMTSVVGEGAHERWQGSAASDG